MRKVSALMHLFRFYIENATSVTKSVSTVNYGLRSGAKTGERYVIFCDILLGRCGQYSLKGKVLCCLGKQVSPRCCILCIECIIVY